MASGSMLVCGYKLKRRCSLRSLSIISLLTQAATKPAEDEDEAEDPLRLHVGVVVDRAWTERVLHRSGIVALPGDFSNQIARRSTMTSPCNN